MTAMQSPKRGNKKIPGKPIYLRSPSLPIPATLEHYSTSASLKGTRDSRDMAKLNVIESNGAHSKNRHHELSGCKHQSTKMLESGFVGFGAPHPKLNCTLKQQSLWSLEPTNHKNQAIILPKKSSKDDAILKSAERLVQNILQNDSITINIETIQMAMQQSATLQAKKRYTSLLEKPWRITTSPLVEECSQSSTLNEQMSQLAVKNPKSFRRSVSSDGPRFAMRNSTLHGGTKQEINMDFHADESHHNERQRSPSRRPVASNKSDNDELEQSKQALHEANQQILSLHRTIEAYKDMVKVKTPAAPKNDNADVEIDDESLSSTNIDDDDNEIVAFTVATAELNVGLKSIDRPLEYIRAISPDHRSKKIGSSENAVSRLEYRALQIRNEQLLHTIKLYEGELDQLGSTSNDEMFDATGRISSNLGVSSMSNEQEKDIMVNIVSRLNVADGETSRQLKYMESKIAALVHQLNFSESKCKSFEEADAKLKATIEDLTTKLTECELKAKEFNENLMIQTEQRIDSANKAVQIMGDESKAAKADATQANMARLAYETKYLQLEQTHGEVVQTFQNELSQSEAKSKRLQNEVNNLLATSVEIIQLTTDMQSLQKKLQQSESIVSELRSNEHSKIQAAVDEVQSRADTRIAALELSLAKKTSETDATTRRLVELEAAQAKEQNILSEELRDSETTIVCLMEEIEALKPLLTIKIEMEQLMKDRQDEFELKQMEIAECKAALAQSECEVNELRNELQMLTSLPDIVRKMQKELKDAQTKLATQKSESKKNLDSSMHTEKEGKERKQLELQLKETNSRLAAMDLESSKHSVLQRQFNELQEAYHVAEDEVTALKSQVELLRPLALDLENAERELEVTCEKLDSAERELEILSNELELMKPLTTDLDEAERELADARSQLAEKNRELENVQTREIELQSMIKSFQASGDSEQKLRTQIECANNQVVEMQRELETAERKFIGIDAVRQGEIARLSDLLRLSEENVAGLQIQLQNRSESETATHVLDQLRVEIEQKNEEIVSLQLVVSEKVKEVSDYRALKSVLEADLNQKEQTILELTPLVETMRSEIQDAAARSTQITLEYATLIPERDTLRKRVLETSSKITILESEIQQKNTTIQGLTAQHNDKSVLESLQQEHERTLERCSDLSLQLAESQFTIGQLTEQLRGHQRTAIRHPSPSVSARSTSSGIDAFRSPKALQSLLNNGLERISSRLDDSLRGTSNSMSSTFQDNNNSNGNQTRAPNAQSSRNFNGV